MLTIEPVTGNVPPCGSQIITFSYDFNTIAKVMEYLGSCTLNSNDPNNPEIEIKLTAILNTTDVPVLKLDKNSSSVTSTGLEIIEDQITITNIGTSELAFEIKDIDFNPWLEIYPLSGNLSSEESQIITLSYDFADVENGEYLGSFKLLCNDPLHPETEIMLYAYQNYNGISDKKMSLLYIYPNPAKEELRISNYELRDWTLSKVEVFDVYGRNVLRLEIRNPKPETIINISSLTSGVYFIKIDDSVYKFMKY
jgi:hypothetical protein